MSDYLNNLVARTLNAAPVVQPRLPSLFESGPIAAGAMGRVSVETETPGNDRSREPTLRTPTAISANVPPVQLQPRVKEESEVKVFDQKESGANRKSGNREESPAVVVDRLSPLPATKILSTQIGSQAALPQPGVLTLHDDAQPKAAAPAAASKAGWSATERDREENWPRLQPRIRQLVDEQLSRLQPTSPGKDELTKPEQSTAVAASTSRVGTERSELPTIKPTPHIFPAPIAVSEPAPTVNVTIGRVDVRAIVSQQSQAPPVARPRQSTPSSLDEYLRKRSEGRR